MAGKTHKQPKAKQAEPTDLARRVEKVREAVAEAATGLEGAAKLEGPLFDPLGGYASELDRREAVRKHIVDTCVMLVLNTVRANMVTASHEERVYLEGSVAIALLKGLQIEAMSLMLRKEML